MNFGFSTILCQIVRKNENQPDNGSSAVRLALIYRFFCKYSKLKANTEEKIINF